MYLHYLLVPVLRGVVQRGGSVEVLRLQEGARVHQRAHHAHAALAHRQVQRRVPIRVVGVQPHGHVARVRQQQPAAAAAAAAATAAPWPQAPSHRR
jgi:hypothetical protein